MEILEHMKTVKKDEKHNHNADRAPPAKVWFVHCNAGTQY